MRTKQELFKDKLAEYLTASTQEKGRILDLICGVTKVHRKAAIRRFRTLQMQDRYLPEKRGRPTIYGPAIRAALKEVWEDAHQICAERLHPIVVEYVSILRRDKMWSHNQEVTDPLLTMSLGTMKKQVETFPHFKDGRGRGATKPSDLKEIIPVRRGPWKNPHPGYGEVDTVAHCGSTLVGDYAYTVQYTDVATIWTCLAGQWSKGEVSTLKSMQRIKDHLPFRLLGIDPDSGSEFINWNLKKWCDQEKVTMTRTRPYMKNDHARIEQKNYTNIRKFIGFVRIDNAEAVAVMNELYDNLEDYINFFLPSVKCLAKGRISSRYVRKYDQAQTAYQRILAHPLIGEGTKEKLKQKYATLNPRLLKQKIDRLLNKLYAKKSIDSKKRLR